MFIKQIGYFILVHKVGVGFVDRGSLIEQRMLYVEPSQLPLNKFRGVSLSHGLARHGSLSSSIDYLTHEVEEIEVELSRSFIFE